MKLIRQVRIRDEIELSDGSTIPININVQQELPEIIKAFESLAAVSRSAQEGKSDQKEFYLEYARFLKVLFGESWAAVCSAVDDDAVELVELFNDWVMDRVVPAITEASNRRLERAKKRGFF